MYGTSTYNNPYDAKINNFDYKNGRKIITVIHYIQ